MSFSNLFVDFLFNETAHTISMGAAFPELPLPRASATLGENPRSGPEG